MRRGMSGNEFCLNVCSIVAVEEFDNIRFIFDKKFLFLIIKLDF
jgi:hypothetical protein